MDPNSKDKAKMYPKEKPSKEIMLSSCQCEFILKVIPPKPKELTKEQTREPAKDQVKVSRPSSS